MSTKKPDRSVSPPAPPNTIAYWLEDELGNRISRLFATSDKPLRLAGRGLENVGSLAGWTLARRDCDGVRHAVVSDTELEDLAKAFMPARSPTDADALRPFNEARRAAGFRRANIITDERVY